jgi:hypothetical protein
VTDTRLSPRNAAAAAQLRASLMTGGLSTLIQNITKANQNVNRVDFFFIGNKGIFVFY